jgi:uncharacterized membrane protein YbaN (DUF454 family)
MWARIRKIVVIVLGVVFILLGVAGLFLPILQGVLCLLIGMNLLGREVPWVQRQFERLRARYPAAFAKFDAFKEKVKKKLRRKEKRPRN